MSESLLASPPKNPVSRISILVNADGILAFEGEVVETASKERVRYRFLATAGGTYSWDKRDNGTTVGLCFDSFGQGVGKPEWEWFGEEVKVRAVLVALRGTDFKKERRPILNRFLVQPTEATFRTRKLMVGDSSETGVSAPNPRSAGGTAPTAKPSADEAEVMKRLTERRERELKQ